MSNLSAPPHWSSFVDWGKQCDGITWGNAEKATPEGPNESVKYKSMREFPIDVKYSSGVYVKKMYKVDSERQKRDFARRKKEMEIQAEKEKRLSKGGMKPTPNKDKFEKIMKKNNIKKLETQASIILRDPIPDAMLKFLKESKMRLKSTNETVSNDIDHKTHVYTGSMSDLYELFQLQKKKVKNLIDMRFRFESSNWNVLNELFPYVTPVFKQLLHEDASTLTPGPPHVKLDGGMCHINSIHDVIDIHPPLGTVYVWFTRDDNSHIVDTDVNNNNYKNDDENFLLPFDQSLIPKPKRKRPKTISDFKIGKSVTYARGCATANFLDARSPIKSFPTHKPVHWKLQEKEREKKRAQTAILTDQIMEKKEKVKKEKVKQRRAKTAALLNRRKKKKKKEREEKRRLYTRQQEMMLQKQQQEGENGELSCIPLPTTATTTATSMSMTPNKYHRVHTPIPYPTLEQQQQFLPLNSSPTSLYNLNDTYGRPGTTNSMMMMNTTIPMGSHYGYHYGDNERDNLSTAPSFKNQLQLVSRRSRRRERKIVEKADRLRRSISPQKKERSNNLISKYEQKFRVKTLYKIDNIIGDAPVEEQQSPELKWRVDLVNQSILSIYYPNATLSSPPGSPLSPGSAPPETKVAPNVLKLDKLKIIRKDENRRRRRKKSGKTGGVIVDPVKDARNFVRKVKRRAEEKFLKAHPKGIELRKSWQDRLKSGTVDFSDEQKAQSLYREAKKRSEEKAKERLSLIVDHMKDVRTLISREARTRKKKLRDIARKALWQAQKAKLRKRKEEAKRLKAIQDAAFAASEAKRVKYWIAYIDPQTKLKYWHHKYWGFNKFCEKEPLHVKYYDLSELAQFQFDLHKYHVLREPETQRIYLHDVKNKFCRWYEYNDFEIYSVIKIQSVMRQYLGATRHDTIKKTKCITPLQARARGWLLRKKNYDTKVKNALEEVTISHITNVKSRVTSYENLWKVIEEPKPKKKKKFKRRV